MVTVGLSIQESNNESEFINVYKESVLRSKVYYGYVTGKMDKPYSSITRERMRSLKPDYGVTVEKNFQFRKSGKLNFGELKFQAVKAERFQPGAEAATPRDEADKDSSNVVSKLMKELKVLSEENQTLREEDRKRRQELRAYKTENSVCATLSLHLLDN